MYLWIGGAARDHAKGHCPEWFDLLSALTYTVIAVWAFYCWNKLIGKRMREMGKVSKYDPYRWSVAHLRSLRSFSLWFSYRKLWALHFMSMFSHQLHKIRRFLANYSVHFPDIPFLTYNSGIGFYITTQPVFALVYWIHLSIYEMECEWEKLRGNNSESYYVTC